MSGTSILDRIGQHEGINFALTNRIPRRLATRFMGWLSHVEQPLIVRTSMAIWQRFGGDLNLGEAKKARFTSLHDCFTRELKEGARPVDPRPDVIVSPCDAEVVAAGCADGGTLIQAKDFKYTLEDLLVDPALARAHRNAAYVTLRLRSNMYHRFHAPGDCDVDEVIHVDGDTWNVNPIALRRVERLYCRNERVVIRTRLAGANEPLTLVPVGAILVGSIHLNFIEATLNQRYAGPRRMSCNASFRKGEELGYFHYGSTIVVLAGPGLAVCDAVREGTSIRMGQPLFLRAASRIFTAQ